MSEVTPAGAARAAHPARPPAGPLQALRRGAAGARRLRITCVLGPFLPVPPLLGGAVERIWLSLCGEFAARGHQVTLVSRSFEGLPDEEIREGVQFVRVPSVDAPSGKIAYRLLDIVYALRVSRRLPAADITITNSVSLPLLVSRAKAGKIYVSVARFPKGQMGFYRRADRLQAVSRHVADAIIAQSPSIAPLVRAIPNAISPTFADALAATPGPRARQIVFVGRLAREKGIDLLIRAFALLSDAHRDWSLVIIGPHDAKGGGDGPAFLSELQALAAPVSSRVTFVGPVFDEAELAGRLQAAAVFVYPSVAAKGEALPLAPVEAMACGCAVVTSALDCFDDYLVDNQNGLRFDHADSTGGTLARTLERLLLDASLRTKLGRAAVDTARRYTRDAVATTFLDDFADLLDGAGNSSRSASEAETG